MSRQDALYSLVGQWERVETCAMARGCFSTGDGLQPQVFSVSKNLHYSLTYLAQTQHSCYQPQTDPPWL